MTLERESPQQKPTQHKAAPGSDPNRFMGQRLASPSSHYEFEPTAVGTQATTEVALPINNTSEKVTLTVHVEGDAFRLYSMWVMELAPHAKAGSSRVLFAPPRAGVFKGSVVSEARFADGHVERHVTHLEGRAAGAETLLDEQRAAQNGKFSEGPRRLSQLQPIDLGEQVVGSSHTFSMAAPTNLDMRSGFAAAQVHGSAALHAAWGRLGAVVDIEPGKVAPPIALKFEPLVAGNHTSTLQLATHWPDGYAEHQVVSVHARAKGLDDMPGGKEHAAVVVNTQPQSKSGAGQKPVTWDAFEAQLGLNSAVQSLFEFQRDGVDVVCHEQRGYVPPPLPKPLWQHLAELAITVATDGIALVVEGAVKGALSKSLGIATSAQVPLTGAKAHPPTASTLTGPSETVHAVEAAAEDIPGMKDAETTAGSIAKSVVYGVKTAAAAGAKTHIAATTKAADSTARGSNGISSDQSLDFFSSQLSSLASSRDLVATKLLAAHRELLLLDQVQPGISGLIVDGLAEEIRGIQNEAKLTQMRETSVQWLAYKARASLGVETVPGKDGDIVTKLADAREYDRNMTPPRDVAGLIDIHVSVADGNWTVVGADVRGVSSKVAARVLDADLASAQVPVRIVVNGGSSYITRDEAGRVRYSGFTHLDADGRPGAVPEEKQELRTAERMVHEVLGRTLAGWGVASIGTDDTSGSK